MEAKTLIKCRKCRTVITTISSHNLLNAHSELFFNGATDAETNCPSIIERTEVYLKEDAIEQWIQNEIEKSGWTKGKLKCVKCSSNVGSFDYISGQKCDCQYFNQPSVHFIKSKIDLEVAR